MQFFFGMFLADLSNHAPIQQWASTRAWTRTILSPALLLIGLFLASYPEDHAEWMSWSASMYKFSTYIIPEGYDTPRFFTGFGLELVTLSIHFSPCLKDLLSNRFFLWLGKQSFAVFLIHGTLIRWVLAWGVYGVTLPQAFQDENGTWQAGPHLTMRGPLVVALWLPLWFILLYSLANLWVMFVDPVCARWTLAMEKYVLPENGKGSQSSLPR